MLEIKKEAQPFSETFRWPDSMWPINPSLLDTFPSELMPEADSLGKLIYPWQLLDLLRKTMAERITETRIAESAKIGNTVNIEGPVWIGEGVKIFPFATIIGPVYLGSNTTVGNFTQLRETYIGANVLVGERTSVTRSVMGNECSLHRNYLGDSMLAARVIMGGGTTTANLRLDDNTVNSRVSGEKVNSGLAKLGAIIGEGARFGTTCQIMPGVKIGRCCIIGPRALLFNDILDNRRVRVGQELQVEELQPASS
jgi:UDP-N-acetylglucosamine diphosphorylase / glucose-1-phosphate thymidylyltransferase / UDP-N-acetylgalactosamine diphosphorylase / glucosamine-1-phosphate N-acetyltransferase / galactosamine-1-phosphate N-acetyltransferase